MPRRFFSRITAEYRRNDHAWYLKPFRFILTHPVYFSATRRSVAGGLWLGLFVAFLPIPAHTIMAVLLALILRVNIAVAAIAVWVTNPVTFGPIFYLAYRLGAVILNVPIDTIGSVEFTWAWMTSGLTEIWKPLLLGCFVLGAAISSTAYIIVTVIWRLSTAYRYRQRHLPLRSPRRARSDRQT